MDERHRHRYEVNPTMVEQLEAKGLRFVGKDETGERMEIVELTGHPYFVASQFHPEFKSRPGKASPLFLGLILAASGAHFPLGVLGELCGISCALQPSQAFLCLLRTACNDMVYGFAGTLDGYLSGKTHITSSNLLSKEGIHAAPLANGGH